MPPEAARGRASDDGCRTARRSDAADAGRVDGTQGTRDRGPRGGGGRHRGGGRARAAVGRRRRAPPDRGRRGRAGRPPAGRPHRADPGRAWTSWRDTGVTTTRVDLFWADIAPSRPADPADPADPAYDFARADLIFRGLAERGITPDRVGLRHAALGLGRDSRCPASSQHAGARPAGVRRLHARARDALRRHLRPAGRGDPARGEPLRDLERAQPVGLLHAPVREGEAGLAGRLRRDGPGSRTRPSRAPTRRPWSSRASAGRAAAPARTRSAPSTGCAAWSSAGSRSTPTPSTSTRPRRRRSRTDASPELEQHRAAARRDRRLRPGSAALHHRGRVHDRGHLVPRRAGDRSAAGRVPHPDLLAAPAPDATG